MAGRERTDDDIKFIELVLHLFKNLLVVPDAKLKEASGGDNLSHMHDDLIVAFDQENVLEMLLIMTQVCCCFVPLLLMLRDWRWLLMPYAIGGSSDASSDW